MGLIRLINYPVQVYLEHNDVVIETVDDGFGGTLDVYRVERVNFVNLTEAPWRLNASDGITSWETTLSATENGSRNIPPPQRYKSFPLGFSVSLIRN